MKAAYKWLAFIIAAEVVVQAAAIAFGYARLGKYVDGGATLTKDTDSFPGMTSLVIHGVNGMMVIPALAIAFLVVAVLSRVPGAAKVGGILLGMILVQVMLGIIGQSVPFLALLHGILALGIFGYAAMAGVRASRMENQRIDQPV
jgi:hypothetical protein